MKTMLKMMLALVLCAILTITTTASALALDASVTYEGNADRFVFLPGNDLFSNFKGVMPGDTLTQQITVRNDAAGGVKVKIYLRAEPVDGANTAFLSQMALKVVQEGNSVLYDAAADGQGGLASNVCLGTFYSGADIDLSVELKVPVSMGNDFQQNTGLIRWVFTAEEMPSEPGDPDTGETAGVWVFGGLFALSAAGLLALRLLRHGKVKGAKSGRDISM